MTTSEISQHIRARAAEMLVELMHDADKRNSIMAAQEEVAVDHAARVLELAGLAQRKAQRNAIDAGRPLSPEASKPEVLAALVNVVNEQLR